MPDDVPAPVSPESSHAHGIWFWRLAIFEGVTTMFVVGASAIVAAGATWDEATFEKTAWWQWALFWLSVSVAVVKSLQGFISKTVSSLTAKAKQEDDNATNH